MKHFSGFVFLAFIISCSTKQMNIEKGSFNVPTTPPIKGSNSILKNGTNRHLDVGVIYGKKNSLNLIGIENKEIKSKDDHTIVPGIKSDLEYVLNGLGFDLNLAFGQRDSLIYRSLGIGLLPFPNVNGSYGFQGELLEIGVGGFLGMSFDRTEYEGEYLAETEIFISDGQENIELSSDGRYSHQVDYKAHLVGGLGSYIGLIYDQFGVYFSSEMISPWLMNSYLPISDDEELYHHSIEFPNIYIQRIGVTYSPNDLVHFTSSMKMSTTGEFDESVYGATAGVVINY